MLCSNQLSYIAIWRDAKDNPVFLFSQELNVLFSLTGLLFNLLKHQFFIDVVFHLDALLPYLRAGQMLSLESTTYPGTTKEELQPRIESQGFKIGNNFFLVYSPEREDPGNLDFKTHSIPKVCGGTTKACLEVSEAFYSKVIDSRP